MSVCPTNADAGDDLRRRAPSVMLSVRNVAAMLRCSPRTVYRLAAKGRMPRPVKLGKMTRWNRAIIEHWIARGCPPWSRRASR